VKVKIGGGGYLSWLPALCEVEQSIPSFAAVEAHCLEVLHAT